MTVWGSIHPYAGKEVVSNRTIIDELTHRVWVRYDKDNLISPQHRIQFTNRGTTRTFQINAVMNYMERDNMVEVLCKEIDT